MDPKKTTVCLILLLLLFLCLFSIDAVAVALSGSVDLQNQEIEGLEAAKQLVTNDMETTEAEELYVHGRMNIEITDYPGSGANNRHNPPGKP